MRANRESFAFRLTSELTLTYLLKCKRMQLDVFGGSRMRKLSPRLAGPTLALIRTATLLGCALSFGPTPAAARTRVPVPPSRDARPAAAPWEHQRPVGPVPVAARAATRHPALHSHQEHTGRKLFPRATDDLVAARARRESMARHPAGRGERPQYTCDDEHVVTKGETLWQIADRKTTGGPAAVADEVKRIHRVNRATIGPDPDLILPGQLLSLPGECDR